MPESVRKDSRQIIQVKPRVESDDYEMHTVSTISEFHSEGMVEVHETESSNFEFFEATDEVFPEAKVHPVILSKPLKLGRTVSEAARVTGEIEKQDFDGVVNQLLIGVAEKITEKKAIEKYGYRIKAQIEKVIDEDLPQLAQKNNDKQNILEK